MQNVLASAMEAELGALFVNCKQGAMIRIALHEMGHSQPPKPVVSDSATIYGFVNENIRQCRSRAIDTRLYWVQDRVKKGHYLVYWLRGKENLANYFTNHHLTKHLCEIRSRYLVPTANVRNHSC